MPIDRDRRPPDDGVDDRLVRIRGDEGRVGDRHPRCRRRLVAATRRRHDALAGVKREVDRLDAPVERLRERARPLEERGSGVVRPAAEPIEELAERHPGGVAHGRGRGDEDVARAVRAAVEARQLLMHRAGEDDAQFRAARGRRRHERGELTQARALVRTRRFARAGEDRRDRRVEDHRAHRQRVGPLEARGADPPAGPFGRRDERAKRSLRRRHDRQDPWPCRAGDEPGDRVGPSGRDLDLCGEARICSPKPRDQLLGDGVDSDAGGQRQRPEETPLARDAADEAG
ncbi:MAG: hypothetical protein E6J17_00590 [Chloroflexi bacterium]|nr:MAG: hypothetical protein E6J17_00590 [Chloroflexota bacterium]